MDSADAALLKDIDPAQLGDRLRAARVAKGWTQTQLAGEHISVGYVSRIEAGQRRPNAAVLEDMATRLGVPVDHLLRGVTQREYDEIKLALDFAELSLESGAPVEAESQARQALDRATVGGQDEFAYRAHYLIARAVEAQGNLDDAILELEPLVYAQNGGVLRVKSAIALCRTLRQSGDMSAAIEVGERVGKQLEGSYLAGSDEAVQLTVTLASAYFRRGDTGHAIRLCRKAIVKAEELDSPIARASAYWNASVFESEHGSVANAVPLAERALSLLAEGADTRNLARLRTMLGNMQLQLDPPNVAEAQQHLEKAAEELIWSSASAIEVGQNKASLARAQYLDGNLTLAEELCEEVLAIAESAPLLAAETRSLLGEISGARGDIAGARQAFHQAVFLLTGVGADREAAQLWYEIADLLEGVGESDAALQAYRSAAAASGLRARPKADAPQLTGQLSELVTLKL